MDEIILVNNIFNSLELEYPGKMENIRGIHLMVGALSNVQPILMQNAFEAVQKTKSCYNKTSLHVIVLPILIHCSLCDKTTEVFKFKFVCSCGKPCKNIVQGQELLVTKVEFAEE